MFNSQKYHPKVREPAFNFMCWLMVDYIYYHMFDLGAVVPGLLDGRPVVVAFVEVVPVHLVHSHCEHLLVLLIDPLPYYPVIQELVYVQARSVSEVEDQRVPQGLRAHVVGSLVAQQFEQFFVEGVSVEEIFPDLFFEVGVVLEEDGLAG